jgi:hypothetical protein
MAKRKLPKRLFKNRDVVSSYKSNLSAGKLLKRMSRDHEDVLQNIEFFLVQCYRQDPEIDDRAVDAALQAYLNNSEPEDEKVGILLDALDTVREFRSDVDDEVWRDAVRTVRDSVRRHSSRRPGETGYLDFVAPFVP